MSSSTARRQRRVEVYNPTHLHDTVQAYGAFYAFAPRSVGKCNCAEHNQPGAEDNVGCHDVLEHEREEKTNRLLVDAPRGVGGGGKLTADKVADFIVSDACRGDKHFVILDGSPAEREELKRNAEKAYVGFHMEIVEAAISEWESNCARFRADNPTKATPTMPREVAEHYAYRARHREAVKTRAEFVCDFCGFEADAGDEFSNHVKAEHPNVAANVVPAAAPVAAATERPPSEAEDGRRVPAGAGKKLLGRAESVGLELTVADKKGLLNDDFDVVQDVDQRVEAAKAAVKAARKGGAPAPAPAPEGAPAPATT